MNGNNWKHVSTLLGWIYPPKTSSRTSTVCAEMQRIDFTVNKFVVNTLRGETRMDEGLRNELCRNKANGKKWMVLSRLKDHPFTHIRHCSHHLHKHYLSACCIFKYFKARVFCLVKFSGLLLSYTLISHMWCCDGCTGFPLFCYLFIYFTVHRRPCGFT